MEQTLDSLLYDFGFSINAGFKLLNLFIGVFHVVLFDSLQSVHEIIRQFSPEYQVQFAFGLHYAGALHIVSHGVAGEDVIWVRVTRHSFIREDDIPESGIFIYY